jgi:hypothetical protein
VSLFAGYLADELGCQMALLGIQPADTSFDAALSLAVRRRSMPSFVGWPRLWPMPHQT